MNTEYYISIYIQKTSIMVYTKVLKFFTICVLDNVWYFNMFKFVILLSLAAL